MATRWGICSSGKISHDFTVALKTLPPEDHQDLERSNLQRSWPWQLASWRTRRSLPKITASPGRTAATRTWPEIQISVCVCVCVMFPCGTCQNNLLQQTLFCADVVYVGVIHPYHLSACLLFTNAKKNVLCEKPLAMNASEVKEILAAAKRNNVFLMEAVWTRFFPASVEIRRLLARGEAGEVKMVRAEFGVQALHIPRSVQKELGAGAMLDLGIYCLQFICMVYGGEKPDSIQAAGVCLETGVDETVVVTLKFSRNRMAVFTCSASVKMPNEALIMGTKGIIRVPDHMWCPTSLVVNGTETQYPVPEPPLPLNFINSTGMRYEAEEVRQCLLKGLKESSVMSHADSLLLAEVEDEVRRQLGVVYSQDAQ